MPKKTFITKDFFVNASALMVKGKLLTLPQLVTSIKLVRENTITQTTRFLYQYTDVNKNKHIDVSILELNESQSLITLHCSFVDGAVFIKDLYVNNAIENFERAVKALLNNNIQNFTLQEVKRKPFSHFFDYLNLKAF